MSKTHRHRTAGYKRPIDWFLYQIRLIKAGANRGNPLFVGVGSTKLFLLFVSIIAFLPQKKEDEWSLRVWSFLTSPSNEIGDTLAGIAGALAFLWIIVTVMLQSKELAAQREELRLTRQEFHRMAKAQEKQEELHREQYRTLSVNSDMQDADQEFEELIQAVRQNLYSIEASWIFDLPKNENVTEHRKVEISFIKDEGKDNPALLSDLSHKLWMLGYELREANSIGFLRHAPKKILEYPSLIVQPINRLSDLKPSLSAAKRTKFDYLGLATIKTILEELEDEKWWLDDES